MTLCPKSIEELNNMKDEELPISVRRIYNHNFYLSDIINGSADDICKKVKDIEKYMIDLGHSDIIFYLRYSPYSNDSSPDIEVSGMQSETIEECRKRLETKIIKQKQQENDDRKTFERLKAKFMPESKG